MAPVSDLKQPHDLYVAFAFAAADVLFEVEQGRIAFAVGAAVKLLGRPARLLAGMAFAELITPAFRGEWERATTAMDAGNRVRGVKVTALRGDGATVQVVLSGYRHPDHPERLLVAMAHTVPLSTQLGHRMPQSGLLDGEAFRAAAGNVLRASATEEPYRLTLLDLPEMAELRSSAGVEATEAFVAEMGARLRALSAGGDTAGQLSDTRYCVVHSPGIATDSIEDAVREAASLCAPTADIAPAVVSSLVLDVADVPADDIAHVLAYALNSFTRGDPVTGGLAGFAASLQPRLSATVREMRAVREVISSGGFDILYQPIVDLWTNVVHHFECLIRFSGEDGRSPYDTVVFAEDTGLAGGLDLAVAERTIEAMRSAPLGHPSLRFAINLSGGSLCNPPIAQKLRQVLGAAASSHRRRLLLEITESAEIRDFAAANAVVQEFRSMGYQVCLDDFGAGNAAFHYLRALEVDHVKIDGSYIRDLTRDARSAAFVRAIVNLSDELGISTIAEYVEDVETANVLKLLKVRYGQGYLYGKPTRPGKGSHFADSRTPWVTPALEWRNELLHWRG